MQLKSTEIILIIEALKRAAKRQESEARFDPRNAGPHERKAGEMRRLALRMENYLASRFVEVA